jgi:RNA polymerase sigma factor (TIGR02999 family)
MVAPDPGEDSSTAALFAVLYRELHALAQGYLRKERPWHTLQATALVHEAFLQLSRGEVLWRGRDHFVVTAARAIRRVLVNHAEARAAQKRGGGRVNVVLDADQVAAEASSPLDILAVEEALARLEQLDPRQARIVELRWFGGLSIDAIAGILGVSPRTIDGDLAMAKAWLLGQLGDGDDQ